MRDEADPFARLHQGRRLFLPSLAPGEAGEPEGRALSGLEDVFPTYNIGQLAAVRDKAGRFVRAASRVPPVPAFTGFWG